MATYTKFKGNSLWLDIPCPTYTEIDAAWGNWTGAWQIRNLSGSVILSGSLEKSVDPGFFYLRIGPVSGGAAWSNIAVGTYVLETKILNGSKDYVSTEEDKLVIAARGF